MSKPTKHPFTGDDGRAYHTFGDHGMCVRHGTTPNHNGHCNVCLCELEDLADPIDASGDELVATLARALGE